MLKYLYKGQNRSYKFLFITTAITILLVSVMDVLQGFLFMLFMNRALGINNYPLWLLIIIGFAFVVIYYLVSFLSSYLLSSLLKRIREELVHDSLTKYLELKTSKFMKTETPSTITNFINNEIENLVGNFYSYIFQLFGVACSIILGLTYLSLLSFYFVIPIFVTIIILVLVILLSKKKINSNYASLFEKNSFIIKLINNISNFFLISKMFSYKKLLVNHIDAEYSKYNLQKMKTTRFDLILEKINGVLSLILFISLYAIAVALALVGDLNGGEIVSVIQVCSTIISPFFAISFVFKSMSNTKSTRDKITKLLSSFSDYQEISQMKLFRIVGRNLSFSYSEDKKILDDFSFEFEIGDHIGIIGESGTGKSTFLKIISKIIECYSGEIIINNELNLHDVTDENYFSEVKLLTQEPILLNDSVKNNIVLNNSFDEGKFNNIFNELKLNIAFEDINFKIDTEKQNFSLGEARRICLARILYSSPKFIFLDEPFASLDEENRLIIENVLLKMDNSCIVIASHIFSDEFYKSLNKKYFLNKH